MNSACELSIGETNELRKNMGLNKLELTQKVGIEKKNNTNENVKHKEKAVIPKNVSRKNITNKKSTKKEKKQKVSPSEMVTRSSNIIAEKTENIKTISESYNDDVNDVETWVKKTKNTIDKKLEQKRVLYSDEEKEEKIAKTKTNRKEATQKMLKSGKRKKGPKEIKLKVEHKNEDIKEEMILTLKDKNVLDEKEEKDCLINEELKTQNQKNLIHKNDQNYWNKNYYDPLSYYDINQKQQKGDTFVMLPKYDDEQHSFEIQVDYEEKEKGNDAKVEQDSSLFKDQKTTNEQISKSPKKKRENKKKKTEAVLEDILEKEKKSNEETNDVIHLKKRKIQNIKKRNKEDRWDFLFDGKDEEKKNSIKEKERNDENEVKNKKKIYETKQEKENEKENEEEKKKKKTEKDVTEEIVKKLLEDPVDLSFELGFDRFGGEEEDAEEVYTLLEKVAELKKKKVENKQKRELAKYMVLKEGENGKNKQRNEDKRQPSQDEEKKLQNEIIKLTETSEFCKNIILATDLCKSYVDDDDNTHKRGIRDSGKKMKNLNQELKGTNNILKESINEDVLKNPPIEKEENVEEENEDKEVKHNEYHNEKEMINEPTGGVSKLFNEVELDEGLFGALTYLKTKGELNMEEKIYRNPENRPLHMPTDKDAIKLDYKNETGKVMTPKETFRHISWIFHGKKQGKNKLEKKIKRMEIERKLKENPIDSLPTLNVLKRYQETKRRAYCTISNKM